MGKLSNIKYKEGYEYLKKNVEFQKYLKELLRYGGIVINTGGKITIRSDLDLYQFKLKEIPFEIQDILGEVFLYEPERVIKNLRYKLKEKLIRLEKAESKIKYMKQNYPELYNKFEEAFLDEDILEEFGGRWIFGSAYIGSLKLTDKDIIDAWSRGKLVDTCPQCNKENSFYVFGASGSILSGGGSSWGICVNCKRIIVKKNFYDIFNEALKLKNGE